MNRPWDRRRGRTRGGNLDAARDQDLPVERALLNVDPANGWAWAYCDRYGFESWAEIVVRPLGPGGDERADDAKHRRVEQPREQSTGNGVRPRTLDGEQENAD